MYARLNLILFLIASAIATIDVVWVGIGHFDLDTQGYVPIIIMLLLLLGGSVYYGSRRSEPAISATLACTAFLVGFSAASSLLNYLLLTVAGPRIDLFLASIDRSMGFNWPALMAVAARHHTLTYVLRLAYLSVLPQTAVLVLSLGWMEKIGDCYGLCLSIAAGAIVTIVIWTFFPSFGALTVFNLSPVIAAKLDLVLTADYGRELVQMLRNGPGHISVSEMRGLIGFPSFHTVWAIALMWYARNISLLRWPFILLNVLLLIATPIHGGHFLTDVLGGGIVAVGAIALADWAVAAATKSEHGVIAVSASSMVPSR